MRRRTDTRFFDLLRASGADERRVLALAAALGRALGGAHIRFRHHPRSPIERRFLSICAAALTAAEMDALRRALAGGDWDGELIYTPAGETPPDG